MLIFYFVVNVKGSGQGTISLLSALLVRFTKLLAGSNFFVPSTKIKLGFHNFEGKCFYVAHQDF